MPRYNGNTMYLEMDGVDVSAFFTATTGLETTNEVQDVTAGSGQTHVQRLPGLSDTKGTFTLIYQVGSLPSYIQRLQPGQVVRYVYGPEGNASGKPVQEADVVINSVKGPDVTIKKELVKFEVAWDGADKPIRSILNGDVF